MKKVLLSLLVVTLLGVTGLAQSMCRVSVTFSGLRGPDKNATLTIFRVLVNGSTYSNKATVFRTDQNGVLLGADNQPGVQLPQGAVVWLYANAAAVPLVGLDFNPNGGTPFQVPNKLTATIYELQGATTLLRAQGDMVYGGVDGLPTRLPAGANGRCLVMVSGIPTWAVCPGGGGGGSSVWGGITGSLPDQTDLQSALDAKANTSALAAVALSGAYNDLTGKPTLGTAAALNVAASGNAASGEVVKGDDTRLSDSRTPTSHTHPATDISDSTAAGRTLLTDTDATAQRTSLGLGTAAVLNVAASGNAASGEVVKGDDTRLSDARTPTAHTHAAADTISGAFDVARIPDLSGLYSVLAHTHNFASLSSKPTTLSGYGITDAQGLDQDLTDIAALTANGLLRRSSGVWAMDSNTYLTGNQTITLSGDLSGSGATSISATIANNAVSDAKIRQSAGLSLLGRSANSTGNIADITAANDGEILRRSGTSIGFGTIATAGIGANQVTNAKLTQVATATFKGRTTAGTGDPEDLTATQATALLNAFVGDSGSGGTKGLVPAPAAGDAAANKVLGANGNWVTSSAAPGGSDTWLQRNNAGAFGGISGATSDGTNVTFGSGNLRATSPRITTDLLDANGNSILRMSPTGSATQSIGIANNTVGNAVSLTASTPTQTASAQAGTGFNFVAAPAVAGSSNAGAANGGSFSFTTGDGARLTSGNGNSGDFIVQIGELVGSGTRGAFQFRSGVSNTSEWQWYKDFTDTSNYSRIAFGKRSGSDFYVVAEKLGTGVAGQVYIQNNSGGGMFLSTNTGGSWNLGWNTSGILGLSASNATIDVGFKRVAPRVVEINDNTASNGGSLRSIPDSPTQITADQNNYQAGSGRSMFYRLSTDASRNVTGLNPAGGTNQNGEVHYIINVGSNNIVLVNESASSTAGNRFTNSTGADITLAANEAALLIYDNTSSRWRVFKQ